MISVPATTIVKPKANTYTRMKVDGKTAQFTLCGKVTEMMEVTSAIVDCPHCMYAYIYIYIRDTQRQTERERERDKEKATMTMARSLSGGGG